MDHELIRAFANYGITGLMLLIACVALAYMTKRFLNHLETQAERDEERVRSSIDASIAVANNLHRMNDAMTKLELSQAQHDRDASERHQRLLDRLDRRQQ